MKVHHPVHSFENLEDMLKFLQETNTAADNRILPWQHEFKVGDCFLRLYDMGGELLPVFGEIYESPYPEDQHHMSQSHMQNHRLAKCYSFICPEGEPGSVHISTMHLPITRKQFEEAKEKKWDMGALEFADLVQTLKAKYYP